MIGKLHAAKDDLVRSKADRVWLAVLAAMILLFAALALLGVGFGTRGLLFVAGGLLPAALLWATDRSERWRKPAAVGMVLLFPLWAALGVLSLSVPMLELFLGLSVDFEPGAGSFVRGTVTVGMILGSMRLFGLADRRDR